MKWCPSSSPEVLSRWKKERERKRVAPERLKEQVARWRGDGRTIATLNGSFDLLHAGHLYIIYEASRQADVLLLALNSDASIRRYKSPQRPIVTLEDRLQMVAALEWVTAVTWFEETDPRALLSIVQPDVHVNGAEYGADCIEAPVVRSHGGRLHLVDRIPGLATTEIVAKIKSLCD
jgi:D-glycero-beta-D-manno-heptose 1-phosphate adenylyltransferase